MTKEISHEPDVCIRSICVATLLLLLTSGARGEVANVILKRLPADNGHLPTLGLHQPDRRGKA